MNIAAVLRELMAAGLSGEALVEAVERIESSSASDPMANAIRQARYRERGGARVPAVVRRAIFERDGFACVECDATDRLECDHIHPVSKGGSSEPENLQTLCRSCNARKGDRIRKAEKRGQVRTCSDNTDKSTPPAFPLDSPPNEISNPPLNPPITPPENFRPIAKIDPFDAFWRAYPRRTAKLAAQKAFASAIKRGADPNAMTAAAQSFADSHDRDPQFTPHPATWLNQGRYDDQPQEQHNGRNGKPKRDTSPSNPMVLAFARMAGHIDADGNPAAASSRCDATGTPASPREHPWPDQLALSSIKHH